MDYHSDNQTNDMYSNINHKNVQQEQTTHNSLYRLANSKLQWSYDLEDLYKTNDWKSTNSHKRELFIAYDNKVGNNALRQRVFYALYIRPSDNGNGHLIYRLSTDQILVMKEYQWVPVPEDLIEAISNTNSYDKKIQIIHFNNNQPIVQDDQSNNHNEDGHIHINDKINFEDESYNELNSSPKLNGMDSNKIVNQGYQILLPVGSSKFTRKSMKHNGITNTSMFLQGFSSKILTWSRNYYLMSTTVSNSISA